MLPIKYIKIFFCDNFISSYRNVTVLKQNYLLNKNIVEVTGQSPGKTLPQVAETLLLLLDGQKQAVAWNCDSLLNGRKGSRGSSAAFTTEAALPLWRTQTFTALFVRL